MNSCSSPKKVTVLAKTISSPASSLVTVSFQIIQSPSEILSVSETRTLTRDNVHQINLLILIVDTPPAKLPLHVK